MLSVIILTFNEERHIGRAINSVSAIADRIYVVDSGSRDRTVQIAQEMGATVFVHQFTTQARQFNWAIESIPSDNEWVLRLDADEIVSDGLAEEILRKLPKMGADISGIFVPRRIDFLGKVVRRGGVFPVQVLRIFRLRKGRCEDRWMDEHIVVSGATAKFRGEIVDQNLNSLSWWIDKHNSYASREVVDILNYEFGFISNGEPVGGNGVPQKLVKRWLKEKVYLRFPTGLRSFLYFIYRYIFRLGFWDRKEARAFHVLQGFWYRYLVDIKLHEVVSYMQAENVDVVTAIRDVLGIDVRSLP